MNITVHGRAPPWKEVVLVLRRGGGWGNICRVGEQGIEQDTIQPWGKKGYSPPAWVPDVKFRNEFTYWVSGKWSWKSNAHHLRKAEGPKQKERGRLQWFGTLQANIRSADKEEGK